ncbi:glycoside hydrolase/deacetylase [Meira miltonrushii]|uniref:chitin deacetylase n=1 Tax=Meira miltonrushii TaxID=1280837 RepID=A0A316V5Z8_9BASI|nr:glycoside hydrolase/deacetylase [Meira miltonrushii]PWN32664.1 glycoside hydrolase/deacetylase [Meira miltonrushii]
MKLLALPLATILWCLLVSEDVQANIGKGIPSHENLIPRVGKTTDRIKEYNVIRRSSHAHSHRTSKRALSDQISENVARAAKIDGLSLPLLQKRQSGFGATTSNNDPGDAAQHGSTEEQSAGINNAKVECTPYNLPAIATIKNMFPTVWDVADLLPSDTEAIGFMKTINASGLIPSDIGVRGTQPASLSGAGLDGSYPLGQDPDCWWTDKQCTTPKHQGLLPDIVTCDEPMTWGYTFDDGPNCTHNALYDMWKENNQKASLMYIGSNVIDWPLEAQRGIVDGHHICAHTWSHKYMTALTTDQAFAELWYTIKAIKYVMGITVTCWRPPYGDVDDRIRGIAQGLGLRTMMWNVDTNDWNVQPYGPIPTASLQQTYSSIISMATQPAAATGGVIVLEHELEDAAMNMTIEQYPAVKKAWKNVVPLTACLNITNPYPEAITYPDFAEYTSGNVNAKGLPASNMKVATSGSIVPQGTMSGEGGLAANNNAKSSAMGSFSLPSIFALFTMSIAGMCGALFIFL